MAVERPELVMAMFPNGKTFIELESLIAWFEGEPNEKLRPIADYAAYTLKGMRDRGTKAPNRVMDEETYLNRDKEH